jgi:protease-4
MSFETEAVLDRRRLRRRLSFWRILAVLAGFLAVGLLSYTSAERAGLVEQRQIARITIEGNISEDRALLETIKKAGESKKVVAVILFINSPGGTTAGGEALFDAIRTLTKSKPVVAQFGTIATSAAYMAGIASDRIFARGSTITGSVGVIYILPEISGLMDKLGIKINEIKSGPLKANPSPFQPIDDPGRTEIQRMVAESKRWFIDLVRTRRGIDTAGVEGLELGRVYSGRDALTHKLIDQLGGEPEVVKYLEDQRGVPKSLKIVDWKPQRDSDWGLLRTTSRALAYLTGMRVIEDLGHIVSDDRVASLRLDGLLSIWHGSER